MRALLLSAWFLLQAPAHPGADAHLHATEADRCDPEVRARRVSALIDENRLAEARSELTAGSACPRGSAALAVAHGELLRLEGDPAASEAALTELLRAEPGHSGALEQRALSRLALDRPADAAADLVILAEAHPDAVDAWIRAHRAALQAADPALADQIFTRAAKGTGAAPTLLWSVADGLLAAGDARGALAALVDAPDDALRTWVIRTDAHLALGEPEAEGALGRALELARAMRPSPARTQILAQLDERRSAL